MDELTMERYGPYIPWRERTARPRSVTEVDWRVVEKRQRILNEALRPRRRAA
jgi:hypothetical protein